MTAPTAPTAWLDRFEAAIAAAESGAPPLSVVDLLSALDPNMAVPLGERFADPGSRALRADDARPLLQRLLALVRAPTSTTQAPKLSRDARFLRVRLARLLRLSARLSGFASVRVWPGEFERLRRRSTGAEGVPEPASSFGYSIFNPHVELPIGMSGVLLEDVDVWDARGEGGGAWVPFLSWADAVADPPPDSGALPRVLTCPRCGVDVLSAGRAEGCGA